MLQFDEDIHTYTLDGKVLPSVTKLLVAEGFVDTTWFTEWSREKGGYVHLACHLEDINDLDESTLDPLLIPYLEAYRAFKRDSNFIVESSEVPLASEAYQFAGTPDKVGKLNGSPAIIDIKSGLVSPVVGLQLAFYEILTYRPHKRFGLQLTADGKYKLIPFTGRQDRNLCLSILAVYFWKSNNLRR